MKITIIGSGYVGLATGTCLAKLGNYVTCVDIDKEKISHLKKGISPIYEPGLEKLIRENLNKGRLSFTSNPRKPIQESEIIFITVGTPSNKKGKVNISYLKQAVRDIGEALRGKDYGFKVIVNKSTVPVQTGDLITKILRKYYRNFEIVSNPEFLREGRALSDTLKPDRIVLGIEKERAKKIILSLYKSFSCPILITDIKTAETIKYAANAFLATEISFINEIANFCEKVGADVTKVARALKLDKRIGPYAFLSAGAGWGGSCFPKDVRGLISQAKERGLKLKLLQAVKEVNQKQRKILLRKIKKALGNLKNKTIAVWGLAFKPGTDDMREAPSISIINQLVKEEAIVRAFDPVAEKNARKVLDGRVVYCPTLYDTLNHSDALVILTEWDIFKKVNLAKLKKFLRAPNIIDGRNIFNPGKMKKLGFKYMGIGRG